MAAKISQEMREAQRLIEEEGITAYMAAKRLAISPSTVYRSSLYKSWIEKIDLALRLIEKEDVTPVAAAKSA